MDANSITTLLDELGKKLSGPAEQVWEILIKQAIIYGIADIVGGLLLIGLVLIPVIIFKVKKIELEDIGEGLMLAYGLASFSLLIWAGALIIFGTIYIVNPEYQAIRELIKVVK